jgi:hypothetical protein
VGNDDDVSEITLAPLERNWERNSPREGGAIDEAQCLRANLSRYWEFRCEEESSIYETLPEPDIEVSCCLGVHVCKTEC